jgi:2-polyprenyl-3-methyl-5-hydroxy-6-metoxy-1,4-benzoquinol methylase
MYNLIMDTSKTWDEISEQFNTYKKDLYYGAAANIDAVWPEYLSYINKHFPKSKGQRALDFGCGTGMFCGALANLGFAATGIDYSPQMIKIAKEHLGAKVNFSVGDSKTAKEISQKDGKFNLITSIMVLQFIDDIKSAAQDLSGSLADGGHLLFTNHNPAHLDSRGVKGEFFAGGSKKSVPIYKRSAQDYDNILLPLGFKKTMETYIKQSEEFIKKYNAPYSNTVPKYLIQAYQKIKK